MNKMKTRLLLTALTITVLSTGCSEGALVLQQTAYVQSNGDWVQEVTAAGKASDAVITLELSLIHI